MCTIWQEANLKPCLTTQLLSMFKLRCEQGIILNLLGQRLAYANNQPFCLYLAIFFGCLFQHGISWRKFRNSPETQKQTIVKELQRSLFIWALGTYSLRLVISVSDDSSFSWIAFLDSYKRNNNNNSYLKKLPCTCSITTNTWLVIKSTLPPQKNWYFLSMLTRK